MRAGQFQMRGAGLHLLAGGMHVAAGALEGIGLEDRRGAGLTVAVLGDLTRAVDGEGGGEPDDDLLVEVGRQALRMAPRVAQRLQQPGAGLAQLRLVLRDESCTTALSRISAAVAEGVFGWPAP